MSNASAPSITRTSPVYDSPHSFAARSREVNFSGRKRSAAASAAFAFVACAAVTRGSGAPSVATGFCMRPATNMCRQLVRSSHIEFTLTTPYLNISGAKPEDDGDEDDLVQGMRVL